MTEAERVRLTIAYCRERAADDAWHLAKLNEQIAENRHAADRTRDAIRESQEVMADTERVLGRKRHLP